MFYFMGDEPDVGFNKDLELELCLGEFMETNKEEIEKLRKENKEATMFNLVGFQTNLIPAEQKRVFSKIKALENAEFARYGAMHKNIFINAPKSLNKFSQLKNFHNIFNQIFLTVFFISS